MMRIWSIVRFAIYASLVVGCAVGAVAQVPPTMPAYPREARAVWVATVSNIDWPSRKTLTTAQQQAEARAILNKCVALNINVVVLQVRPACDAIYPSNIEPWSPYLTGTMGKAPSPYYDPLQFWVDEAHARGIEIHAWFNPYRALVGTSTYTSSNHISKTRPDLVRTYGNYLWLDPGEPEVPGYSLSVIKDVITRYDVDGVHFDDYFYPYPISGTPFPDSVPYDAYRASGGTLSLADWRRSNVDKFVSSVYSTIKATKPWVKFGVSPFGIWQPGYPPGVRGFNAYADLYADSRKWITSGWVDYLTPQLYWKISATYQSYPALLDWWIAQNWNGRHIWPGNYTSGVGADYGDWPIDEILNQIQVTRSRGGSTGNVHFSMRALMGNWKGLADALAGGLYATPALVPASTWLDSTPPAEPLLTQTALTSTTFQLSWLDQANEPVRIWAVNARYGDTWQLKLLPSTATSYTLGLTSSLGNLNAVAVAAVDRVSNVSTAAVARVPGPIVAGTVGLNDFVANRTSVPLTVELRAPGSTTPVESHTLYADASGQFSFTATKPGTYDLTVKGSHWLRGKVKNVKTGFWGVGGLSLSLVNGDVDGNNRVDAVDYSRLARAFRSRPGNANWNPNADLNGDGAVDPRDYAILARNFRKVGEP